MKRLMIVTLLGAGLAVSACSKKEEAAAPAEAPKAATPKAEAPKAAAKPAAAAPEIVVPADLEEDVAAEITADNYAKALDSLESEISAE